MSFPLSGADPEQLVLLPHSIDDYVKPDSDVRFIAAFVDFYDPAAKGFKESSKDKNGRPSYQAKHLLALFIYGYLNGIRSSRRLEEESLRNMEAIWLLKGLKPDNRTIARFRRDNAKHFPDAFSAFNKVCCGLEMFGNQTVAIDGAKILAVNNKNRHVKIADLRKRIGKYEQEGAAYQAEMDRNDAEDDLKPTSDNPNEIQDAVAIVEAMAKKERAKKKAEQSAQELEKLRELEKRVEANGGKELSLTDADAVLMRDKKHKGAVVAYNQQAAVDDKHHLVLAADTVTDKNDMNQLGSMALQTKAAIEAFGLDPDKVPVLRVLADAGYQQIDELEKCEKAGIEAYVADANRFSGHAPNGVKVYGLEQFLYDEERDVYVCPAGQVLSPTPGITQVRKTTPKKTYVNGKACATCALIKLCTTGKKRKLRRRVNQAVGDRAARRMKANPEVFRQRKSLVEHVFGTLRSTGHDRLLTRGITNVKAELSLSFMTYNMRRAINVLGVPRLITALTAAPAG